MRRTSVKVLVVLGVLFGSYFGTNLLATRIESSARARTSELLAAPTAGTELVAVLLITENCPAAKDAEFRADISRMLRAFKKENSLRGYSTRVQAALLSGNSHEGFEFLSKLGAFDEVVIGGGWLNSSAVRFVWRDDPGLAEVPQLVLFKRRIEKTQAGMEIGHDTPLLRVYGAPAIRRWYRGGMPVPL